MYDMATKYANGTRAWGLCDCCGQRFLLSRLKPTYVRGKPTGFLSCATCWDPDHPQNFQGVQPVDDPQALRNPRPDVAEAPVPPYNPTFIG